jgi:hypothetical protein
MRADAAFEQGVAIVQQVLGRDRGAHAISSAFHEFHRARGGDVLEHHAQPGKTLQRGGQDLVDEPVFALEHVDVAGDLAVHQKGKSDFAHACEHVVNTPYVCHARVRVRRGAGRI